MRLPSEVGEYGGRAEAAGLFAFRGALKESDLVVCCDRRLDGPARAALARHRHDLEDYIREDAAFLISSGAGDEVRRLRAHVHKYSHVY